MNEQWPSERHAKKQEVFADSSFKTVQDFLVLLSAFPNGLPGDFEDVATWVVEQDGDLAELEKRIVPIVNTASLQTYPDGQALLMTLVCAAALARMPSLQTWLKVNAFKYNSWQLEHWLGEAMLAYVEVHPSACSAYIRLAKEAFEALENFSLSSKSDRINQERVGAWTRWSERLENLEEIWWDLRSWHGFMNYKEELPLFQVFYMLDRDEFVSRISSSSNPYLVSALLFAAGIGGFSPRFSEWKLMVAAAPVAFEDGGRWNGSVLMPLLLVDARNQLLQVRQNLQNTGINYSESDEIKREIISTSELIVNTLANRQDAPAIFARWTPWLMRQILGQTEKEIADVKSPAFSDEILIDAIGRKVGNSALPQAVPDDASLWEAWCYRCVLASFAYSGHIQVPDWARFRDEWNLSHEDWASAKGHLLRGHASLITTLNKEIPGIGANLLAYPIAQSPSPVEAWIDLWNGAIVLREIVEFGDSDATEDDYSSRSEAGRLLLLLFRIGLSIFDQGTARTVDNSSPEARSLVSLFAALNFATYEMQEIDSTLNRDEWLLIIQHLAIRRMIWENSSESEIASGTFQVFKVDDTPTVSDILSRAKGDVTELVAILQSLFLNSPDASRLKTYLYSESIDLSNIVYSIKKLNQFHSRKYPIDEAQLQKLG